MRGVGSGRSERSGQWEEYGVKGEVDLRFHLWGGGGGTFAWEGKTRQNGREGETEWEGRQDAWGGKSRRIRMGRGR